MFKRKNYDNLALLVFSLTYVIEKYMIWIKESVFNKIKLSYAININTAITIMIAFSIKVASVIGSFKAVPRQAH